MSAQKDPLETYAAAMRELTGGPSDGRATRARVVRVVARRSRRPWRRIDLTTMVTLGILTLSSGAIAWTVFRRAASPSVTTSPRPALRSVDVVAGPPPSPPSLPAAIDDSPDELAAYDRAHEAHFRGRSAARALAAWNEYLRLFPEGSFAPEARFNRAICLVRLRDARAAAALRPFAERRFGPYRAKEACELLRGLATASMPRACEP